MHRVGEPDPSLVRHVDQALAAELHQRLVLAVKADALARLAMGRRLIFLQVALFL